MLSIDLDKTIRFVENVIGLRRSSFEHDSLNPSNTPCLFRIYIGDLRTDG